MSTADTTGPSRKKRAMIISGYACIGKTYFCGTLHAEKHPKLGRVVDLDSSTYNRDRFPENYLEDVRRTADSLADEGCVILVSTFPGVSDTLKQEGYYVAQVYPQNSPETKTEWLRRLEVREKDGKESRLYGLVSQHWDEWYDGMEKRNVSKSIRVSSHEYLSTVIDDIYEDFEQSEK